MAQRLLSEPYSGAQLNSVESTECSARASDRLCRTELAGSLPGHDGVASDAMDADAVAAVPQRHNMLRMDSTTTLDAGNSIHGGQEDDAGHDGAKPEATGDAGTTQRAPFQHPEIDMAQLPEVSPCFFCGATYEDGLQMCRLNACL